METPHTQVKIKVPEDRISAVPEETTVTWRNQDQTIQAQTAELFS